MYRYFTVFLCLFFIILGAPVQATERLALVIGNSDYQKLPLNAPENDARDMAAMLRQLGFEVILEINADQIAMESSIQSFGQKLQSGTTGLFYYSGHGVQYQGANYLIPIGAMSSLSTTAQLRYKTVNMGYVLGTMKDAGNKINLVIMDACRNNPFKGFFKKGISEIGLANMQSAKGTLIAYATSPGKVAEDGPVRNSPYTKYLLQFMQQPELGVEKVFKKVGAAVSQETNNEQTPWYNSSIYGDFYFVASSSKDIEYSPRKIDEKPSISLNINFVNDSAQIYSSSFRQIKEIAKALQSEKLKMSKILIEGPTENQNGGNEALSKQRAVSLKDMLVNLYDINPEHITTKGSKVTGRVVLRNLSAVAVKSVVKTIEVNKIVLAAEIVEVLSKTERKPTEDQTPIISSEPSPEPVKPSISSVDAEIASLLATCETHFKANRLTSGRGGTALSCYEKVLKKDSTNAKALEGIQKIEARYISWIKQALDKDQTKRAEQYLASLRLLNPESPQLAVFEEQLKRATLQQQSPKPSPEPVKPINFLVDAEIASLLATCETHFKANRLTSGRGGTALSCYEEVLKKDSTNAKALEGIQKIEARYISWIKQALDKGQTKRAEQYLASLRLVNPESPQLAVFEEQLKRAIQPPELSSEPVESSSSYVDANKIARLLATCEKHFNANSSFSYKDIRALECYIEVFKEIDLNNMNMEMAKANNMIYLEMVKPFLGIFVRYAYWVKQRVDSGQEKEIEEYLAKLRSTSPEVAKFLELSDQKLAQLRLMSPEVAKFLKEYENFLKGNKMDNSFQGDSNYGTGSKKIIGTEALVNLLTRNHPHEYMMLIDVRNIDECKAGHIPHAICIPNNLFYEYTHLLPNNKNKLLIYYCHHEDCHLSIESVQKAKAVGYTNVVRYASGINGWVNSGLEFWDFWGNRYNK
jgi:rhodanese-related sulfurtransferase/outer membrane protein OmpA-like peptidoglycan-associated protein